MTVETYGVEQLLRDLREYTCPVHGCEAALSSGSLLCRGHWRLIPADLKREVYEAVRKLERIAKRYDTAQDGSPRQARLADEWLEVEILCREVQLRAVIVASERAGARPDVVGSAPSTTPRKGGCMKIKTSVNSDGTATVAICNELGGAIDTRTAEPGGEAVEVNLTGVETGQVSFAGGSAPSTDGETAAGEGEGEGQAPDAGEVETPKPGESATSATSEKPLYRIEGDAVPEGFTASGLETPDGATLYHYAADTAGESATGNADAVSVYADADDDDKPVVGAAAGEAPPQ